MYGKCVVEDYNSVHKDKCAKEFLKLKDCYLVSRLWCHIPSVLLQLKLTIRQRQQQKESGDLDPEWEL